jgi:hypothetical protein
MQGFLHPALLSVLYGRLFCNLFVDNKKDYRIGGWVGAVSAGDGCTHSQTLFQFPSYQFQVSENF